MGFQESINPVDLERVLARATGMKLPPTPVFTSVETRLAAVKLQIPLQRALEDAIANSADFAAACASGKTQDEAGIRALRDLVEDAKKEGLDKPDTWLEGVDGHSMYVRANANVAEWDKLEHERELARQIAEEEERKAALAKQMAECQDAAEIERLRKEQ